MIYLDHAATSWPKPPEVVRAMAGFLEHAGGNPGRSGHRLSVEAGRIVYAAREAIAELFHAPDPMRVFFAANATQAINLALIGLLKPGDRVVTTAMEHNAVMRPLRHLEQTAVSLAIAPCAADGALDLEALQRLVTPGTRLVVVNHASNVFGSLAPLKEISAMTRAAGALLLVDAAQTAGAYPIDMQDMGIDLLAFTGHKSLQGPPGTGGLAVGAAMDVSRFEPLIRGGTGSRSEFEEQPEFLPDKFESGTPNGAGIAGLGAGINWVIKRSVAAIRRHETALARRLREGLSAIPNVVLHGPAEVERGVAIVSFTVAGKRVSEIGQRLDEDYGVLCRVGLHCAPAPHRALGTFPEGTVRLAPGPLTTPEEIDAALHAVTEVAQA